MSDAEAIGFNEIVASAAATTGTDQAKTIASIYAEIDEIEGLDFATIVKLTRSLVVHEAAARPPTLPTFPTKLASWSSPNQDGPLPEALVRNRFGVDLLDPPE